jgi:hypothetical protein
MSRVLVLAGGADYAHDFPAIGTALVDLVESTGREAALVDHPDDAARALRGHSYDALVIDALFWRMLGDAYEQWRDTWAYSPSADVRDALTSFVADGGGLVAVHTTPICFDDWPEWGDVLGGSWQWGVSSHPPSGPVVVDVVAQHPVVDGLAHRFELTDEVYGDLDLREGVEVLAVAKRHPDDDDQPVVWAHRFGTGRVVFDGFGHDAASIAEPNNAALIANAIEWVTGN